MNRGKFPLAIVLSGCFFLAALTGCETGGGSNGDIKMQGVYTTVATPGMELDMPASQYLQKKSFDPGETPAAVILGYGDYQQQLVTLEVTEVGTGRSLLSKSYYASYGKAFVQPLQIRLSGDYELKLRVGETRFDSWQFAVNRTNSSGIIKIDGNSGAYARGILALEIQSGGSSGIFSDYDNQLDYSIVNFAMKGVDSANPAIFAQRFPGKVVIQCRQDSDGSMNEPKILENTLDDECAQAFQDALLKSSPYSPWPEPLRRQSGSNSRTLKLTFSVD